MSNTFHIRLIEDKDVEDVLSIYRHYVEHTAISFEYSCPSTSEFSERIRNTLQEFPWLVCVSDGTVIGYAFAHKHRPRTAYQWSSESSIYLSPAFQTKGIGRVLYQTLFDILRMQGYYSVFAGVALPNEKSVGLHQRLGFEDIGIFKNVGYKNGTWLDTRWFQLVLIPPDTDPIHPLPFPQIKHTEKFTTFLQQASTQITHL